MARVGDAPKAPPRPDDHSALERSEIEPVVVECGSGLGVGDGQHLEAVIEEEPVDDIGLDPSSDRVGALEHDGKLVHVR